MKNQLFIIAFILCIQNIFAQDIVGSWKGELEIQGMKLPLVMHVQKTENGFQSTMDSPLQGAKDIPVDKTTFENNQVIFEINVANFVYQGQLNGEKIEGTLSQSGMNFPMILNKMKKNETALNRPQTPKPPFNYKNEEVKIQNETEGNWLSGTLTTPFNFNKKNPVFILITGSGAQDRNSEILGHQPFWVIADDLAKKGIATLRLDDRGMGASENGKENPTSVDFAGDISAAVNYLVKMGYQNIGLMGHSEGGMIAPLVAQQNKKVKALILLAAPGIPTDEVMKLQTYKSAISNGFPEEMATKMSEENALLYSFVKKYEENNFEKDFMNFLENLSKNEFSQYKSDDVKQQAMAFVNNAWFQYFIRYNPDHQLSKIKIPVLAINGSLDSQITAKENLNGIKKSIEEAGNKNFKILEFPQLNHLLQTATTGSVMEYAQIEETISPQVLDAISEWILKL